ncbi:MAG: TPM domain-containing protein [Candidatus Eisenbacteria bacterium]|nr:TPM domain-containing protein [Candidatus Eisenbacteria bacterium]
MTFPILPAIVCHRRRAEARAVPPDSGRLTPPAGPFRVHARNRLAAPRTTFFSALAVLFLVSCLRPAATVARDEFPQAVGYVNDFAHVIPQAEEGKLEGFLQNVDQKYGIQVAIAIMPDLGGEDPTEYANRLYEAWGVGDPNTDRGLLVLDARKERFVRVEVGYGLEGALPDARTGDVVRGVLIPLLAAGRTDAYAQGALALLEFAVADMGRDPAEVDALFESAGYVAYAPKSKGIDKETLEFLVLLLVVLILLSAMRRGGGRRRGRRRTVYWGGGGFGGGFGGFGGGSSGGGFGGFGGGMSGGGGAGGSY